MLDRFQRDNGVGGIALERPCIRLEFRLDKLARGETGQLLVGYDTRNRDTALRAFSALAWTLTRPR